VGKKVIKTVFAKKKRKVLVPKNPATLKQCLITSGQEKQEEGKKGVLEGKEKSRQTD